MPVAPGAADEIQHRFKHGLAAEVEAAHFPPSIPPVDRQFEHAGATEALGAAESSGTGKEARAGAFHWPLYSPPGPLTRIPQSSARSPPFHKARAFHSPHFRILQKHRIRSTYRLPPKR